MIREAIMKVVNKENLTFEEAEQVMDEIMGGEASQIQMSAFLTALAMKGETIDEITASCCWYAQALHQASPGQRRVRDRGNRRRPCQQL